MSNNTSNCIEIQISDSAFGGDGVARLQGKVIFVPGALPGETVSVEITEDKKSFSRARLLEIIEESPHRIKPACPLAVAPSKESKKFCQGCAFQHVDYSYELILKNMQFIQLLKRFAGVSEEVLLPPVKSPENLYYRNKIVLHTQKKNDGSFALGYYTQDNSSVVDVTQCPLAAKEINSTLADFRNGKNFENYLLQAQKITFRFTENDGQMMWNNKFPPNKILTEKTVLGNLKVPAGSFFQVNMSCANMIIENIMNIMQKNDLENVFDLYCGSGIFSIAALKSGSKFVTGVDCDKKSIRLAAENASYEGYAAFQFICADVFKALAEGKVKIPEGSTVILDPPRRGLDKRLVKFICEQKRLKLIYVSCSPDTLCRDLKILIKHGWKLETAQISDMFPRTPYFETVTLLEKNER